MICSECPRALTLEQVRRGNKTCSKECGYARMCRLGGRLAEYRERRESIRAALLERAGSDGTVNVDVAVDVAMKAGAEGYLRGYDVRLHRERRQAS